MRRRSGGRRRGPGRELASPRGRAIPDCRSHGPRRVRVCRWRDAPDRRGAGRLGGHPRRARRRGDPGTGRRGAVLDHLPADRWGGGVDGEPLGDAGRRQ